MKTTELALAGVKLLEPRVFADERGWSMESYSTAALQEAGIDGHFVMCYHSQNKQVGTLRGIHFQNAPMAQAKLVRCTRGALLDVVVDLRKASPTYKQWVSVELTEENKKELYLPAGFGHGFVTLAPDTELMYLMDNLYSAAHARCIAWNDPQLAINWGIQMPVLSEKDSLAPFLAQCDINFEIGSNCDE